ncbi:hypothetical protein BGZ98_007199 [Dissophora globulifera]|nr:hypothetical protein BGZ98_007199 [Dissophora globulifera]
MKAPAATICALLIALSLPTLQFLASVEASLRRILPPDNTQRFVHHPSAHTTESALPDHWLGLRPLERRRTMDAASIGATNPHHKHNNNHKHRKGDFQDPPPVEGDANVSASSKSSWPALSTLKKSGGKVYMMTHQDWYSRYRRHRGHQDDMHKQILDSPGRRKATFTIPQPGGEEEEGDGEDDDEQGEEDEERPGDRGNGSTGHNNGGKDGIEADNNRPPRRNNNSGSNNNKKTGTIQGLKKRPKEANLPHPVVVKHTGLIPKAKASAAAGRSRELSATGWSRRRRLAWGVGWWLFATTIL